MIHHERNYEKYLLMNRLPHMWCSGCGNGIIMKAIAKAIELYNIDEDNVVIVSGIGCSSRAYSYMNLDSIHTVHGRAIPFATGIKLANPKLKVIVITGDGDCTAIGGNHFIHAARRNIDLTVVLFNNNIYGMTGGQASPLTPKGKKATTTPYGSIDRSFDVCELAKAAGATYIARSTTYHVQLLVDLILQGISNNGFSLVEVITQCVTNYGRRNGIGDASKMLLWMKENAVNIKDYKRTINDGESDKFPIGVLRKISEPEYSTEYNKIINRVWRREE
ncbi:2-oxoacid:ferredoxin oxidoreductase subunit beta [Clostridium felsineum]|uniref:2-oxoacid:ferredoxin oxidoreductase subunit beta n=1 Tax=Clostridium felsineum TaxID=36839 RepID=UPI00098C51AA|nr:2-oxoacid:ferredoxin oxidoreductase subunit beta [Clostridium felsineum]MCR3757901.1 2-oxoacid:ferredoxin oxidoreductase subunit beta [Clostridium felsineum]URZ03587.1 hypothetical protein CLAUR_036480 [Clostridium felsineum]